MSGSINKVILIGNLGDTPKLHRFDEQSSVVRFPLATSDSYLKKGTNERVEQTEWHNIVVRNKLGEVCEKYLNKGDKVYVEGKIKGRKWDDESGQTKYITEIIAENIKFLTIKKSDVSLPAEVVNSDKDLPF